jgi:hypothetical protein
MNGPTRPNDDLRVDATLHARLARRASGRLPDDLATHVFDAIDREPAKPRLSWLPSAGRGGFHVPAPLAAAGGMAAVLVLVAALFVAPGLWPRSSGGAMAGYPADRALTTLELAALMNGPDLALNTTLVADVTITANMDVCPMNRYPTLGVVEGMGEQVCVMGAGVDAYLKTPSVTGTYAFRYIARGYLGLLGEITPASAGRIAHRVTDEWPRDGRTFLVEGWLGATTQAGAVCSEEVLAGDYLAPNGYDCPLQDWLADEPSAPLVPAATPSVVATDPLGLLGTAREVFAGGARIIDSIDSKAPVHGVYVVRPTLGGCPGAPAYSSVGCSTWRVVARVTDIALPGPSTSRAPTPSWTPGPPETPVPWPSTSPSAEPATSAAPDVSPASLGLSGPDGRPLTVDEFQQAWANDPEHLAGRIVIAKGPIPMGFACVGSMSVGCQVAVLDGLLAQEGYFAVRVGADSLLSIVGEIATPDGSFVYSLDEAKSSGIRSGKPIMVDAWLAWQPSLECDAPPYPSDNPCWGGAATSNLVATKDNAFIDGLRVQLGAYNKFGSTDLSTGPIHGIYLVQDEAGSATILARIVPAA